MLRVFERVVYPLLAALALIVVALLLAFALAGCGGDADRTVYVAPARRAVYVESARRAPAPSKVKVRPETVTVPADGVQRFAVSPASAAVVWSVREAGGGTISSDGLYTAPSAAGTYHVVATTGGVSAEATVTVSSRVAITMPATYTTAACEPVQLQATVTGSTDTGVIWSLADPACGALSVDGRFTPSRVTGACVITAVAAADPGAVAQTTVTVTEERVLGVAVTPSTAALLVICGTFLAGAVTVR